MARARALSRVDTFFEHLFFSALDFYVLSLNRLKSDLERERERIRRGVRSCNRITTGGGEGREGIGGDS